MIGQFVGSHRLMPLKALMNGSKSQSKEADFSSGLFGAAEQDGEIYAAPNDSNPPDVFWYDKEALKAAGVTDDPRDARRRGQVDHDRLPGHEQEAARCGPHGHDVLELLGHAVELAELAGGVSAPYDKSGKFVANKNADAVKALDQFGSLFQDKTFLVADTLPPDGAGADSVFVAHKAGFFVQGRYTIGTVTAAGSKDSYDIAPPGRRRTARRRPPVSPPPSSRSTRAPR